MQLSVIERGTLVTVSVCVVLESDRQPIKTEESPIHHLCFVSWMLRFLSDLLPKIQTCHVSNLANGGKFAGISSYHFPIPFTRLVSKRISLCILVVFFLNLILGIIEACYLLLLLLLLPISIEWRGRYRLLHSARHFLFDAVASELGSLFFCDFLRKVMETAEIPKMVTIAALAGGLEEKIERMGSQRITVSDHMNRLPSTDKSKNFVIDMESFAAKDVPPYSRITKSLSKKWSHRSSDEKTTPNGNTNEKKNEKDPILPSPSPRACGQGVATVPEKSIVGTTLDQHCSSQQAHHQITITTLNPTTNTETIRESRYARRNSFRRSSSSSSSWVLDPKRVLFVFASLSSIGTILLIYFTLAIGGTVLDLEQ